MNAMNKNEKLMLMNETVFQSQLNEQITIFMLN